MSFCSESFSILYVQVFQIAKGLAELGGGGGEGGDTHTKPLLLTSAVIVSLLVAVPLHFTTLARAGVSWKFSCNCCRIPGSDTGKINKSVFQYMYIKSKHIYEYLTLCLLGNWSCFFCLLMFFQNQLF